MAIGYFSAAQATMPPSMLIALNPCELIVCVALPLLRPLLHTIRYVKPNSNYLYLCGISFKGISSDPLICPVLNY